MLLCELADGFSVEAIVSPSLRVVRGKCGFIKKEFILGRWFFTSNTRILLGNSTNLGYKVGTA